MIRTMTRAVGAGFKGTSKAALTAAAALSFPIRQPKRAAKAVLITTTMVGAEICLHFGNEMQESDTRGTFYLPYYARAFFYHSLTATVIGTGIAVYFWTEAKIDSGQDPTKTLETAIMLAPGLLAAATAAALPLSPAAYYLLGGVTMLGNFLKRMEMKSRQPEVAMKKVKEQAKADKEKAQANIDQAISERDEAIQKLANQQAENEAKDNTIRELTERLNNLTQDDQQQG